MSKSKRKNRELQPSDRFYDFVLIERLGRGGNGDVWKAKKDGKEPVALKILRRVDDETYKRFKIETQALDNLEGVTGIVPLIEKFLPEAKSGSTPWFTMPVAIQFSSFIASKKPNDVVGSFVTLAEVVRQLHERGIAHRDIKPANFLYYDGQLCLSDFGLVKYPEREPITPERRDIGAKFTMAPEMRRHASAADGLPADVYSFAKSLWIALTGEELGFDGQYNPSSMLALSNHIPKVYTTSLDRLLVECTDTDPRNRPTIDAVIERLNEWLEICGDFHTQNLIEWTELTHKLFPMGAPNSAEWSDLDSICSVLAELARVNALNHMFYPTGGGNTITGAARAAENGMIALQAGTGAEILKPAKLTYESFGKDKSWSYFRLQAAPVIPTGIKNALGLEKISETLTEIKPGEYVSHNCWLEDEHKGERLPKSARPVRRFLDGSFVFFSTRSIYNLVSDTYDARHNLMTEAEFRKYIADNALHAELSGNAIKSC